MKQTSLLTQNLTRNQENAAHKRAMNATYLKAWLDGAFPDFPVVVRGFIHFYNRFVGKGF
jgi:hypothetical protein